MSRSKNITRREAATDITTRTTVSSTQNPRGMGLSAQDVQNSRPHTGTVKAIPNLRRRRPGEIFRP